MLTQEDLQAISQLIKNEVAPIRQEMREGFNNVNARFEEIEETLEEIKEEAAITRDVTNSIGKWIEFYFAKEKPFPIDENEIENQDKILKMID